MKWETVKLGTVVNNLDSRRKPLNDQERSKITIHGLYPYIGANNIMGYVDEYLFDETILCVAEDGGSWGSDQKCAVIYSGKTWVNNHAHVLTATSRLDIRYLMYFLNHADLTKHISGSTRGKLTKGSLESIDVPLPPLHIQEQIADTLDKADALRRKDQELLQKYNQLAQAIFYDMFGDPVRNEKGWKVKTLNEVCIKVTDGTHDTPERLAYGVPFITGKHIKPGFIDYVNCDFVDEQTHTEIYRRCNPEKGDVLYTNIGVNFGTAALNSVEYEFSMKNVALLKPDANIIVGEYLQFLLNDNGFKGRILSELGVGGAQQFLSLKQIRGLKVLVPELDLQKRFSQLITNLSNVRKKVDTSKTEELFKNITALNFS